MGSIVRKYNYHYYEFENMGKFVRATDRIGTDDIRVLLLSFSIPAIIGMLVMALYNITDRIFVGHGVGAEGIAAIAVTMPVVMTFMAASMLIGIGANALFSIKLGEGNNEIIDKIMGHAFLLLFLVPLIAIVPCVIFLKPLLVFIGAGEGIMSYAESYLRIILYGSVFAAMGPGINHFIRSDGHPKTSMFTQLLGAGINIILDAIFILGFGWGMEGAAWATVISQFVSFLWVMYYFNSKHTPLRFRFRAMKLELKLTMSIIAIGFAPFALNMAMNVMNLVLNKTLMQYGGDTAVAVMGIIYSALILMIQPLHGLNAGMQPIVGYNYGAKHMGRVLETYYLTVKCATVFVLVCFVIIQLFPRQIILAFSRDNAELMEIGIKAIRTTTLFVPIIGFQIITSNFFQAVGKPLQSTILSLSRQCLMLIPLVMILPRFFGLMGAYMAFPVADILSVTLTFFMIRAEIKHLKRIA